MLFTFLYICKGYISPLPQLSPSRLMKLLEAARVDFAYHERRLQLEARQALL